jgi:hypothetical protein
VSSKTTSRTALTVSFALHLIIGVLGLFFWPSQRPASEQQAIEGVLMQIEETQVKRVNRPKRIQIQREVTATAQMNQPSLKLLTSNAPPTERGVVSAAKLMPFQPTGSLNLGEGIGLTTDTITTPQAMPQLERVITRPVKQEPVEPERPKSRLAQFIERQEGPQRILYCIDLSSSMRSLPARRLQKILSIMQDSLDFLEPHDAFNIMTFGAEIQLHRSNFASVDAAHVADANAFLKQAKPTGSQLASDKDMLEALQEAKKHQPTIIVLFSDGILTSGVPDLQRIRQQAGGEAKIFSMGIDMAADFPGAVLLRMLAEGGNGEFWLVDK